MIIAGFPGIGKSTLTEKYPNLFLDLDSGFFNKKPDGTNNPNFIPDYIEAIRHEMVTGGRHILVSSHHTVIEALRLNGFQFTIVIPALELCDEYMKRYRERGSPDHFIQKIHDNWVPFIEPLLSAENAIILKSGEVLADVVEFDKHFDPLTIRLRNLKK